MDTTEGSPFWGRAGGTEAWAEARRAAAGGYKLGEGKGRMETSGPAAVGDGDVGVTSGPAAVATVAPLDGGGGGDKLRLGRRMGPGT